MLLWFMQKKIKLLLLIILWALLALFLLVRFWTLKGHYNNVIDIQDNPVILWWTESFPGSSDTRHCLNNVKCDVYSVRNMSKYLKVQAYLFYGSNVEFMDLPLPRRPEDIIWGLYHEESPRNVEQLMHEPVLKLFNYSSTFSRYSDVPFPLQHLESFDDIYSTTYYVPTQKKNSYLQEIAPILYLQSDCETSTERDIFVQELMNITKIDSYGSCLNNKKLPEKFTHDYLNNLDEDAFLKFVARYKFVIAIENGVCDDYVTEKFWRAIKVGTVPIYFGSPSIRDWFPNEKSAILLEDFPSPKVLNEHLKKLLRNNNFYETYLEHKTKNIVTNPRLAEEFRKRVYQIDALKTVEKFECFVCNKIHDKIKGKSDTSTVTKKHYNCPKPLSALQQGVNSKNSWVQTWEYNREKAKEIYNNVMIRV